MIHFTVQNLHLFEFSVEGFRCHVHQNRCFVVLMELASIDKGSHSTKMILLKIQVKILHSEMNILMYYILLNDQDGKISTNLESSQHTRTILHLCYVSYA